MIPDGADGWVVWLLFFVANEGKALLNSRKGDTLSEKVWLWFDIDRRESNWTGKRLALLAGMGWLTVHFVWGVW